MLGSPASPVPRVIWVSTVAPEPQDFLVPWVLRVNPALMGCLDLEVSMGLPGSLVRRVTEDKAFPVFPAYREPRVMLGILDNPVSPVSRESKVHHPLLRCFAPESQDLLAFLDSQESREKLATPVLPAKMVRLVCLGSQV